MFIKPENRDIVVQIKNKEKVVYQDQIQIEMNGASTSKLEIPVDPAYEDF